MLFPDSLNGEVDDVARLLLRAGQHYGSPEQFPYAEIIKSIVNFEGRPKRSRR